MEKYFVNYEMEGKGGGIESMIFEGWLEESSSAIM